MVFLRHLDERLCQSLVGTLGQSICLRVIGTGEPMIDSTFIQQCLELSLELPALVGDNFYWGTMSAYNVSEKEVGSGLGVLVGTAAASMFLDI